MIKHLVRPRNIWALVKYAMSGTVGVGVDISILYLLHGTGLPDLVAVCTSGSVAGFVHYVISRYFVFRSYKRGFFGGLLYFVSIVGVSFTLNIGLYLVLIMIMPEYFVLARIISIAMIGLLSFVLNAHYTFKTFTSP